MIERHRQKKDRKAENDRKTQIEKGQKDRK